MSEESPRQKTNDLEQSYSQFNQIFNASLPLRIINKDYEIVSVNDTYINLFQLNKEENIGRKCYDHDIIRLGHRCDNEKCSMKQIEMGKDFYEYELESKLPDGTNIVNIIHSVPYKDVKGNFGGIIQNFTNITERSKMEIALIESEEKYRTLVEDSIVGIWVIDAEAKTTFANQSMASMFGYEIDEMIGKSMYEFMDDNGIKAAEAKFDRRKNGIREDHDFVFFHKSGKKIYTSLRTSPIFGKDGTFNGALAFITDITEQKMAQEKISDMAKFPFENPNPVLRLSESYVLLANNAAQKLFNVNEGSRVPEVLKLPIKEAFSEKNNVEMEVQMEQNTYNLFIVPIKGAGYANIYGMDITEQKMAQEKISDMAKFPFENPNPVLRLSKNFVLFANNSAQKLFNIDEGSRIPEVLKSSIKEAFLGKTNVELEVQFEQNTYNLFIVPIKGAKYANIYGMDITDRKKAEKRLERFVGTVSHELRTPISVLTMSIDFLENHSEKITPEISKKLDEGISRNIYHLKDLVEDILTLSRIDEGKVHMKLSVYKPYEILMEILSLMEPIGNEKNITFKVEVDKNITLKGDSKKIDQLFRIFIDNAIKYSKENNEIVIRATDDYKGKYNINNKDGILLLFRDSGLGITENDLKSLFQRFFRSDNVSDIPGTGLGLSIAKELIKLHEGDVFVESVFGEGTTFFVFLPSIK